MLVAVIVAVLVDLLMKGKVVSVVLLLATAFTDLLFHPKWVDITISDVPCEKSVGVIATDEADGEKQEESKKSENHGASHGATDACRPGHYNHRRK